MIHSELVSQLVSDFGDNATMNSVNGTCMMIDPLYAPELMRIGHRSSVKPAVNMAGARLISALMIPDNKSMQQVGPQNRYGVVAPTLFLLLPLAAHNLCAEISLL
jgi:hypothetical protein